MEDGCANCGRLDGPRQNQVGVTVCEDCAWALCGNVFGGLEARAEKAERERDEASASCAVERAEVRRLKDVVKSLTGQVQAMLPGAKSDALRVRAKRAEAALVQAERERDEARAMAIDLYLDAHGVGPGRDWGAEEVPSWLSGEGGEVEA